jgi:serine/threonine protein kinase
VGDFGISKFDLFSIKRTLTQTLGLETTPAYVAPEVIKGEASSTKADIWALGIIFY